MAIYAGYSETDITPPLGIALDGYSSRDRGADEIADPLVAQALYLSDGQRAAVIVSLDVCSLRGQAIENVRQHVSIATGVPREAVVVCPSHTHFAPVVEAKPWMRQETQGLVDPEFKVRLIEGAADAARRAKTEAVEARLSVGRAFAPGISFNRRAMNQQGQCVNRLRLPPRQAAVASQVGWQLRSMWPPGGYGGPRYSHPQPEVEGLRMGVTDPEVIVLRIESQAGQPLVALVNFACHPVCSGPNFYAVSADFICYLRRTMAAALRDAGPAADMPHTPTVMFVQGAAGDQVPAWREGDARVRVGQGLAGAAVMAWHCAEGIDPEELLTATAEAELPLREFPDPEQLRRELEEAQEKGEEYSRLGMMLAMSELVGGRSVAPVTITALRVGQWGLVNGAGEIVVEIGLHIKQRSPLPYTMFASLSADHYGYMTTDEALREGGYEAEWSALDFGAAAAQIAGALQALEATVRGA